MRFVSFSLDRRSSYGLWLEDGTVLDLPRAAALPATLAGFIAAGEAALDTARSMEVAKPTAALIRQEDLHVLAPIPRPSKNVFCVGRNYHDHVAEGYRAAGKETKLPAFPQFFTKPPTAVCDPVSDFPYNKALSKALDYEVELAVVIGLTGRDIARGDALDHVFGLTVMNDITGRDLQRRHEQRFKGKGLDRSAPMGPCILTLDAVADVGALELSTQVNGEERQRGRVSQMIFDIPEIIAQLSAGMTLEPGDIVAIGTPAGVGYAMEPPRLLDVGDIVTCTIEGIGSLVTTIVPGGRA